MVIVVNIRRKGNTDLKVEIGSENTLIKNGSGSSNSQCESSYVCTHYTQDYWISEIRSQTFSHT